MANVIAYSNRVKAPVNLTSLANYIGIQTDSLEELCKSDAINIWAVWKPCSIGVSPDGNNWDVNYLKVAPYDRRRLNGFGLKSMVLTSKTLEQVQLYLTGLIDRNEILYRNGGVTWVDKDNLKWFRLGDFIDPDNPQTYGYNKSSMGQEEIGEYIYTVNVPSVSDMSQATDQTIEDQDWEAIENMGSSGRSREEISKLDVLRYTIFGAGGSFSAFKNKARVVIVWGTDFSKYAIKFPNQSAVIPWTTWKNDMIQGMDNPSEGSKFYWAEVMMETEAANNISSAPQNYWILPYGFGSFIAKSGVIEYSVSMRATVVPSNPSVYHLEVTIVVNGALLTQFPGWKIDFTMYQHGYGIVESTPFATMNSSTKDFSKTDYSDDSCKVEVINTTTQKRTTIIQQVPIYKGDLIPDVFHVAGIFYQYTDSACTNVAKKVAYDLTANETINIQ